MEDYLRAKLVWNTFDCKTFRAYHDLYLKSDVFLLTDLFEKCRSTCMDHYGLDAAHYYSAPRMVWDAALKLTGVQLDLFDNERMYTFIERSIQGGISQISKRFAKANNKYCPEYDPLKPIMHLIYLDANNLYKNKNKNKNIFSPIWVGHVTTFTHKELQMAHSRRN